MNPKMYYTPLVEKVLRKSIIPFILRTFNPNYSYCEKCGLPWNYCKEKSVMHSSYGGTFATCDICWDNSSLLELKKYYTNVYNKQRISLYGTGYNMNHTLEHLLVCVEEEYNK